MSTSSKKSNKILGGMAIYAIGTFGTQIMSFLIVPLYTYYISTYDMGVYDLLYSTVSMLTPLVTLQISDAAYRWMVRGESVDDCIESTIQFLVINSAIVAAIIFGVNHFVTIPYCVYFVVLLISSRFLQTIQKLLRGLHNLKLFALSSLIFTFVYLILNVVQIYVLRLGVVSLFTSSIASNILTIILIFTVEKRLRKKIIKPVNIDLIKKMLSFSAPLVPNQLNWWVMSSSDRYIIGYFLGAGANGIYAIAYKFPSLLQVILSLFNTSWQDISIAEEEKDGKYYSLVFQKLYRLSFSMLPALVAATQIYIRVMMNENYHEATRYVSLLYLGTIFQSFSSFYGVGYLREKNTRQASLTSIYGAMINIVINFAMIRFIGLYAAAVSTFIGFFVMWLIREYQNREELQIKIDKVKFVFHFGVALCIACISPFFTLKYDVVVFVSGGIYFLVINKDDIRMIVRVILKKVLGNRKKG